MVTPIPTAATPGLLTGEVVLELYRDSVPGHGTQQRDNLERIVAGIAARGMPAVCMHGFADELPGQWDRLATLAANHGLRALASWGLDSSRMTGAAKGAAMGSVAARRTCIATLADAEGRWDKHDGPGDVTDEDDALAMGEAFRARAPGALVGDQLWPIIDVHGDLRRTPKALDAGGVFEGFPVDEFAAWLVNWKRFVQLYPNEAGFIRQWGRKRYRRLAAWSERSWKQVQVALATAGLARPLGVTLQAYGWDDIPHELMHALLTYGARDGGPVIGWYNLSRKTSLFLRAIEALHYLTARGFAGPGIEAEAAVLAFQRAHNAAAPSGAQIDVDGDFGPQSFAAAGLPLAA